MPMRVDQARHDNRSAAIDHLRAVWRGQVAAADLLNPIALDKEATPSTQNAGLSIEEQKIPEHDRPRGARRSRSRAGRPNKPKRGERGARARDETASRQIPIDAASCGLKLRLTAKTSGKTGQLALIGGRARKHRYHLAYRGFTPVVGSGHRKFFCQMPDDRRVSCDGAR